MGSTTGGRFESFRFVDAGRPPLFFTVYRCISDRGNFDVIIGIQLKASKQAVLLLEYHHFVGEHLGSRLPDRPRHDASNTLI
jgi:hypothetical protein